MVLFIAAMLWVFEFGIRWSSHWPAWVCWPAAAVVLAPLLLYAFIRAQPEQRRTTPTTGVRRVWVIATTVLALLAPLLIARDIFGAARKALHFSAVEHSPFRWLWFPALVGIAVLKAAEKLPVWMDALNLRLQLRDRLASAEPLVMDAAQFDAEHKDSAALRDSIARNAERLDNALKRCDDATWVLKRLEREPDLAPRRLAPYWKRFGRLETAFERVCLDRLVPAETLAWEAAQFGEKHKEPDALRDAIGRHVEQLDNAVNRCEDARWIFERLAIYPPRIGLMYSRLRGYRQDFGRLKSALAEVERSLAQRT